MERHSLSRETLSQAEETLWEMLGKIGLSEVESEAYLDFFFSDNTQVTETVRNATERLSHEYVRSLDNAHGQDPYNAIEQSMIGLLFGRTRKDPPYPLKRAVQIYSSSFDESDIVEQICLNAALTGIENLSQRLDHKPSQSGASRGRSSV